METFKHSDVIEQLFSRRNFISNPSLIQTSLLLYYDEKRKKLKPRTVGRKTPGSAYRLAFILAPQLSMTYDLFTMQPQQIINLLPKEYNGWIEKAGLKKRPKRR